MPPVVERRSRAALEPESPQLSGDADPQRPRSALHSCRQKRYLSQLPRAATPGGRPAGMPNPPRCGAAAVRKGIESFKSRLDSTSERWPSSERLEADHPIGRATQSRFERPTHLESLPVITDPKTRRTIRFTSPYSVRPAKEMDTYTRAHRSTLHSAERTLANPARVDRRWCPAAASPGGQVVRPTQDDCHESPSASS